jgi:hypothetical protein
MRRWLAATVVATIVIGACTSAARADEATAIPWTDVLPPLTTQYEPTSENDCLSGKLSCVDKVVKEMTKRFNPLAAECAHNAMFSLMYLRTTEQYRTSAATPGFFTDTPFINHQDAVFARYYFEAWDSMYHPRASSPALPDAWRIAFEAADAKKVSGSGSMFLGMSAHVNRDLPMVLAAIGLVKPDGSSRKPDHDKVNQFLVQVINPLFAEAARRFDPTIDDSSVDGTHMDETATVSLLQGWREQAWRNAERLVMAATPADRAAVQADIERSAAIEAKLLVAATAYDAADSSAAVSAAATLGATSAQRAAALTSRASNLAHGVLGSYFTDKRAERDAYCATHWNT